MDSADTRQDGSLSSLSSSETVSERRNFVYLGRRYRLKVEEGKSQAAKLSDVFCLSGSKVGRTLKASRGRQKHGIKRARETLSRYMEKCYTIASRHNVPKALLVIRAMRRRWGSCSPSGRITLNLNLVQAPVHCIEYVIMHELCHLKHHNHSKAFYSLLTRCLPDWRKRKETLDLIRL